MMIRRDGTCRNGLRRAWRGGTAMPTADAPPRRHVTWAWAWAGAGAGAWAHLAFCPGAAHGTGHTYRAAIDACGRGATCPGRLHGAAGWRGPAKPPPPLILQ